MAIEVLHNTQNPDPSWQNLPESIGAAKRWI
jgi:hypothetical protein